MRRALALIATGSILVACGLSVEGLVATSEPPEAGVEASIPSSTIEVSAPPIADAATSHDCHVRSCTDDSGLCFVESCTTVDGGLHMTPIIGAQGTLTEDGGLCHAVTADSGSNTATVYSLLQALPEKYRYDVWVDVKNDANEGGATILIGFDGDHSKDYAFVAPANPYVECESPQSNAPYDCGAYDAAGEPTSAYVHMYGEIDRTVDGGTGTVIVETADSATSCTEVRHTTFSGAVSDRLDVFVGCFGGPCDRTFTDAVFKVTPE